MCVNVFMISVKIIINLKDEIFLYNDCYNINKNINKKIRYSFWIFIEKFIICVVTYLVFSYILKTINYLNKSNYMIFFFIYETLLYLFIYLNLFIKYEKLKFKSNFY